jgi:crotonobetainyl-CoA:carnitine CoA-transferase CaiB-like acyl-CoA transferase
LAERTQFAVKIAGYGAVDKSITWHIHLVGRPVTLSRPPSKIAARPREFGDQTAEVLAEFGFGAEEVKQLRRVKVV